MAIDNRDWHREHINRRDGYTETAAFRVGHGELKRRKHIAAWRRNFIASAVVVLLLLAAQFFL